MAMLMASVYAEAFVNLDNYGHGHDHGQAGLNGEELGVQYSLYQKIDLENVTCLNEEIENSGKDVFKAWENRKDRTKVIV